MGFEELKKEIIDDANKKADEIVAQAKKEATEIKKKAEKEVKAKEKTVKAETKAKVEQMQKSAESSANLEAKKLVLQARKKQLDNLFDNLKESVNSEIKAVEKKTILKKLVKEAESQIEIKTLYVNPEDVKIAKTIVKYDVKEADIIGGIVAEDSNGQVKVDLSFDNFIEEVKDKHLTHISEMLF